MKINKKNVISLILVFLFIVIVFNRNTKVSLNEISPLNGFNILDTDTETERFKIVDDKLYSEVYYYGSYNKMVYISDENDMNKLIGVIKEISFEQIDINLEKNILNTKVKNFMNCATSEKSYKPENTILDIVFILENNNVILRLKKPHTKELVYFMASQSENLMKLVDKFKKENKTEIVEEKVYKVE